MIKNKFSETHKHFLRRINDLFSTFSNLLEKTTDAVIKAAKTGDLVLVSST